MIHEKRRSQATRIDTIMADADAHGWGPIAALAQLTATLFQGRRRSFPDGRVGPARKLWDLRPRPRPRGDRNSVLLALLHSPAHIAHLRRSAAFREGYGTVVAWIIDSFRDDYPLRRAEYAGIDLICIIRRDELAHYRRQLGDRVMALNWGADVLGAGSDAGERPVDLLRIGRQPEAWQDDSASARVAAEHGLRFAGRPPLVPDLLENQRRVMAAYAATKFVIAHTNLASADVHTHRVREYITGRWTDALACGATVAGIQPRNDDSFRRLFWPGATLDFDRIDLRHNMQALAEAVAAWSPERARRNHLMALERLDWRHSLKRIGNAVSAGSPALDADLAEIARRSQAAPAC